METPFVLQRNVAREWTKSVYGMLIPLTALLLLAACGEKKQQVAAAPPEVVVAEVIQQDVPVYSEWVAQLNGDTNAQITPKIQGYLLKQSYKEGFFVQKGQLLF